MAVAPGLGKLVPLAVGFQWIFRCQCFDQTDVLTDAMPLGFSMLETPEPSPFSLDAPQLQHIPSQKDPWWLEKPTLIEHILHISVIILSHTHKQTNTYVPW